jgi:ribosomal protein S7
VARRIFYNALDIVEEKIAAMPSSAVPAPAKSASKSGAGESLKSSPTGTKPATPQKLDGRAVFDIALKNIAPLMELKSRRIGGANYQVPMEVQEPRKTTLAIRWLLAAARSKKGQPMAQKLAAEIMDAYNKTGVAMKKREDVHRMAEANKAFAHFARFNRR